jgi:hypothetical protein
MTAAGDSPLHVAKERLAIQTLWHLFNLPGRPGKSCRSPFHEDRNASFSVYDDGRKWHDFATREGGDAADFLARALNLSKEDACHKLIELAGVLPLPNERMGVRNFGEGTEEGGLGSTPPIDGPARREGVWES